MLHSYALEFYLASEQYEDPWNYTWLYKDKGSERVKGVLARLHDSGYGPTRERKLIKWRVNEYNLSDSSGGRSSRESLEVCARVQLDRLRICDSGPQHQNIRPVEYRGGFDDYAPTPAGYVAVPVQEATRNNSRVLSGFITKRGSSKTISASVRHDQGEEQPQTSHWRARGPNWACPFAVHNPARYWEVGNACIGWHGFPNIARVREHLKDVHCPQRLCPNCLKNFRKSEKKYQEHMSQNQCQKRDDVPLDQPEPLSSEQKAVLIKSFDIGTSEEDKWRGYYHVLFPEDQGYKSRSPYFDCCLLPSRMSKCGSINQAAPDATQKPFPTPLTPSIRDVPFELNTTATTIIQSSMSSDNRDSYSMGWNPQSAIPFIDDNAQTVVPEHFDTNSNQNYGKNYLSQTALFGVDGTSLFCSQTKDPVYPHELQNTDVYDQDYASFIYNL